MRRAEDGRESWALRLGQKCGEGNAFKVGRGQDSDQRQQRQDYQFNFEGHTSHQMQTRWAGSCIEQRRRGEAPTPPFRPCRVCRSAPCIGISGHRSTKPLYHSSPQRALPLWATEKKGASLAPTHSPQLARLPQSSFKGIGSKLVSDLPGSVMVNRCREQADVRASSFLAVGS